MEKNQTFFLPFLMKILQGNPIVDVDKFFFTEESQLINAGRMIGYHHFKTYNEMIVLSRDHQELQKLLGEKWLVKFKID